MKRSLDDIEYEIKLNELESLKKENKKISGISPTLVTIIVTLITIFGSFIASFIQKNNELELERLKFESELIMNAVKGNDSNSCVNNLRFFIKVGLIKNNAVKLNGILDDNKTPLLKLDSYSGINPVYTLDGTVLLPKNTLPQDVTISFWPRTMDGTTENLKQVITLNQQGKFKIEHLEEIVYIMQIKNKEKVLSTRIYYPNKKNKNDIKIYDVSAGN
ncbi:hypothetical protein [Mucilaginibacter lappiensis]|uniref:hypothetical protein n=1 Tax=Mucilaginibacter lappiensis TaxID=354630 RepID=UPI003D25563E